MSSPTALAARQAEPVRLAEMVFPNATNHYGTMFGGKVLDLMDRAAFLAASRYAQKAIVTASTERIDFHLPIKHGHLVELVAQVVYAGRTSLTVKVELFAEDPIGGSREHATSGYFHMVALSDDGHPSEVPALLLNSPEAREEWVIAERLRTNCPQGRRHE